MGSAHGWLLCKSANPLDDAAEGVASVGGEVLGDPQRREQTWIESQYLRRESATVQLAERGRYGADDQRVRVARVMTAFVPMFADDPKLSQAAFDPVSWNAGGLGKAGPFLCLPHEPGEPLPVSAERFERLTKCGATVSDRLAQDALAREASRSSRRWAMLRKNS